MAVNACCQDNANLIFEINDQGNSVGTCQVCKRKHYRLNAGLKDSKRPAEVVLQKQLATKRYVNPKQSVPFYRRLWRLLTEKI